MKSLIPQPVGHFAFRSSLLTASIVLSLKAWMPVQELSLPGLQQMTVLATEAAQFFRLLQVP